MRVIVQRVQSSRVEIDGEVSGEIGQGLMVLLGIAEGDGQEQCDFLADKLVHLRIFTDEQEKMNLSLQDINGEMLIVSQFTLYASCKKGNRPSFTDAGSPAEAKRLYELFVSQARKDVPRVETGEFGAMMEVSLINDGPFTIWLDTDEL